MPEVPAGCHEDLGGCQIDAVERLGRFAERMARWRHALARWGVRPRRARGGLVRVGAVALMAGWFALPSADTMQLVRMPGDAGYALTVMLFLASLAGVLALSRYERPPTDVLRLDARHVVLGRHRWPREQVELRLWGRCLSLVAAGEAPVTVTADADSLGWFVRVFHERGAEPVGDASEVPPDLRAVVRRQPEA